VDQHDLKVYFGDLNFRLEEYGVDRIYKLIEAGDWTELKKKDEFYVYRSKEELLRTFNEGPITFPPTYKYQIGTSQYNRERIPAYTDRVFWSQKSMEQPDQMSLYYYNRAEINLSDHKPILAAFECSVKTVDQQKTRQFRAQLSEEFNRHNQERLKA
jgi:hypothetical protein